MALKLTCWDSDAFSLELKKKHSLDQKLQYGGINHHNHHHHHRATSSSLSTKTTTTAAIIIIITTLFIYRQLHHHQPLNDEKKSKEMFPHGTFLACLQTVQPCHRLDPTKMEIDF